MRFLKSEDRTAITIDWKGDHDALEWVITIGWNAQPHRNSCSVAFSDPQNDARLPLDIRLNASTFFARLLGLPRVN